MKNLLLVVLFFATVFSAQSQSFEGTIRWGMKMDITDPKVKAQMEEAKRRAADPKAQAELKQMQDRMNDPQFKQMFDQNPQMKAQMEQLIKVMSGGDMSMLLPSALVTQIKGSNSLLTLEGGIMDQTEILYLDDKKMSYTINHQAKTYQPTKTDGSSSKNKVNVTKTGETTKILGYTCHKYTIEVTSEDGKVNHVDYWSTDEVPGLDGKMLAKLQPRNSLNMAYPDVSGFPLKVEVRMPEGVVTMQAEQLKKESLSSSKFAIPSGYTEGK